MGIGNFNSDEMSKKLLTSEKNGVVISNIGKVRLLLRSLSFIFLHLLVLTSVARSDIVAPASINGSYPLATSNIGGSTANTANTGTLTGLGQNGPYNFNVTASIVRLNAATSPITWNTGLRFSNATTLQFQPINTIYGPSTANGQLGYATYDFLFNNPVLGLTFNWAGIDFGDNIEVFAYNGATAVPILSSYYVINGAQKSAYTPRVDRFNAASGLDTNAAGIEAIDATIAPNTGTGAATSVTFTFPANVKVSRIFVRAGKRSNSSNETVNATTLISGMAWNVETVKVQKKSVGGTGTFGFSSVSNLSSTPANIVTATADVPAPAAPTSLRFTAINTNLSVTESAAAGYVLTGFVCTDSNSAVSGNPATFGTFVSATRVGTIPAANAVTGANITCVFTNTRAAVRVQKISVGGTGTFGFSGQTNLASTPTSIITSTAGVPAPATPPVVPLISVTTVGTAVTITESAVAGYELTGFSCSDANAATTLNPASFGTFVAATRVGTIPAANVITGADITCVFTNTKSPTISLTKALGSNRVAAGDQFTVALRTGGVAGTVVNVTTNSTTTGATNVVNGGTGTTGTFTATAGTAYTLTESASGTTNFSQYASTITCTDSAGLQTGLPSGAAYTAASGLSITPVAGAVISCTLTNTAKAPTLALTKALGSTRVAAGDQFTVALRTGGVAGTVVNSTSASTTTGATNVVNAGTGTTGTFTATAGTAYTLTEVASGTTNFAQYSSTITCSDSAGVQTGLPSGAAYTVASGVDITPVAGAVISCTLTNTAKAPTLALTKALGSNRILATDQFTVALRTGGVAGTVVNSTSASTTTGATNVVNAGTGTTGTFTATAGTAYTLTEAASGTTNFAQYTSAITCSDSAGLQTGLPSGAVYTVVTGLSITPVAGAVISCTLTNTALSPTLVLTKTSNGPWQAAQTGASFTLTVTNTSVAPTVGTITVREQLPTGVGIRPATGFAPATGWTCTYPDEPIQGATLTPYTGMLVTCTSTTSLAGSGSINLTIPVTVTSQVIGSVTNYASIGGGGDLYNGGVAPTAGAACLDADHCASATTSISALPLPPATCSSGTPINLLSAPFSVNHSVNNGSQVSNATLIAGSANYNLGTGTAGAFVADIVWRWNNGVGAASDSATLDFVVNGTTYARLTTETGYVGYATLTALNGASLIDGSTSLTLEINRRLTTERAWVTLPLSVTSISSVNTSFVGGWDDVLFNLTSITGCAPSIVLTKALGSNRVAATDQFTVALRTGGVAGTVVNVTTDSTTTGATNVVTGGTGTTGTFTATPGTAYTLTEAASGTTNFSQYTSAITCTDSAGLQTGLPSGAAYTVASGLTITPVAGAVISCTLTNTANNPILTLAKTVVNTGGGTAVASAWTLTAAGPTNISGSTGNAAVSAATVSAGAYTLSESGGPADINGGAADYSASTYSCVVNGGPAVSGNAITLNLGDTTVCTITNTFVPDTALTIVKRLATGTPVPLEVNQTITYEFEVTNNGNVTVTGVKIEETAFTGSGAIGAITPANGSVSLAPGASTVYTATYTVNQADVDLLQ
jgi:Prealbumin-like fold domain